MAKVSVKETVRIIEKEITLTLSEAEAEALWVVLQYVGGEGMRNDCDNISFALEEVGIFYKYPDYTKLIEGKGIDFV